MKKILALIMAMAMVLALAACGSSTSSTTEAAAEPAAEEAVEVAEEAPVEEVAEAVVEEEAAEEEDQGGFAEFPIWEDIEVAFMNISGVYFQPVPMSGGNDSIEGKAMHFEADVAALADNGLGYGPGDWIPYMTVDYQLVDMDTEEVIAEGTFMPMSADDGPHYGDNIDEIPAGDYNVILTFHSPEENGYLIHLDDETGPGGTLDDYFGDGPIVVDVLAEMTEQYPDLEWDGWHYLPTEW